MQDRNLPAKTNTSFFVPTQAQLQNFFSELTYRNESHKTHFNFLKKLNQSIKIQSDQNHCDLLGSFLLVVSLLLKEYQYSLTSAKGWGPIPGSDLLQKMQAFWKKETGQSLEEPNAYFIIYIAQLFDHLNKEPNPDVQQSLAEIENHYQKKSWFSFKNYLPFYKNTNENDNTVTWMQPIIHASKFIESYLSELSQLLSQPLLPHVLDAKMATTVEDYNNESYWKHRIGDAEFAKRCHDVFKELYPEFDFNVDPKNTNIPFTPKDVYQGISLFYMLEIEQENKYFLPIFWPPSRSALYRQGQNKLNIDKTSDLDPALQYAYLDTLFRHLMVWYNKLDGGTEHEIKERVVIQNYLSRLLPWITQLAPYAAQKTQPQDLSEKMGKKVEYLSTFAANSVVAKGTTFAVPPMAKTGVKKVCEIAGYVIFGPWGGYIGGMVGDAAGTSIPVFLSGAIISEVSPVVKAFAGTTGKIVTGVFHLTQKGIELVMDTGDKKQTVVIEEPQVLRALLQAYMKLPDEAFSAKKKQTVANTYEGFEQQRISFQKK